MDARPLDPPLRIRALQRGLAEGLWSAETMGLEPQADLFSITEAQWLQAYDFLDSRGLIPEALKDEVRSYAEEATRFLDSASHARAFPAGARARFEPLGFLGDGGMGSVYKAYDQRLGRVVALKFLKHLDEEARQRFLQETRAQAQIEHPHIVRIFEAGEFDGTPFLAMQFVDGPTLRQAIPLLSLEHKVRILRDAAEAVHACHRQGILHRDIKPSNIMLDATEEGHWNAYVMDFGLARLTTEESRTQAGFLMGTPAYLSPEQAAGQPFDRRSDVYALGISLYECIAGEPPFSAADTWELLRKIATEDPPSLRRAHPTLPRDLELIIAKAMDKDPLRRYASAKLLGEDLDRFLEGDPVHAQPPTLRYRTRKLLRKHRHLAWVTGISFLLVAAMGGWGVQTVLRARRLAQAAQRFGAEAEAMEGLLFKAYSLPLHDTRAERDLVHRRMRELGQEMLRQGAWSQGAGHFALGRVHLALGEWERAREELEKAREFIPSDPHISHALGLCLAQLYAQELDGLRGKQRSERKQELDQTLRAPALRLLLETGSRSTETSPYAEGLVAMVEERYDEALAKAKQVQQQAPWFYLAWVLEGRVHRERGTALLAQGLFTEAMTLLDEAGRAFHQASERARSAPEPYVAEAQRRLTVLRTRFDRAQAGEEDKAWALEAVRKARTVNPEGWQTYLFASAIHRQWALHLQSRGLSPMEDLDACIAEAREGLKAAPDTIQLLINLANGLRSKADEEFSLGKDPRPTLQAAQAALNRALAQPRYREFLLDGLGNCHLLEAIYQLNAGQDPAGNVERAVRNLEESNALHPWVGHLSSLGEGVTLLAVQARWAGLDPRAHVRRAEGAFQQALALNRKSFQAHLGAAQGKFQEVAWLSEQGEGVQPALAGMRQEAQEALALNAGLPEARALLAWGALAEALEAARLGRDPRPILAAVDQELARLKALPKASPDAPLVAGETALARHRLFRDGKALAPALALLDAGLRSRPFDARLWLVRARVLEALGRREEAEKAYQEVRSRNANLAPLRTRPAAFPG